MRFWLSLALAAGLAPSAAMADTLPEALVSAYKSNPTLEAARAQARSVDETFAQARSGFLPQLEATGTAGNRRSESTLDGVAGSTVTKTDPRTVGVQAIQPVFSGGRRLAQLRVSDASIESAQAALRAAEQTVLLSAVAAFVDVRRDEEVVRIRQSNVDVLARQLQAARDRFEVGAITRTDVAQAEARLAGGEAFLAAARADLEGSRAQYERVIGMAPGKLEATPPLPTLPKTLDEAIEQGIAANPDLERQRQQERVAKGQIGIEASELLPGLNLVGRYDRQLEQQTRGLENETTSATAQLTVPLFDAGFARSRVRQAKINEEQAKSRTEEVKRTVVSQVVSTWNDYSAAQRVIAASKEQVRATQLALDGAEQELQVGLRTTLDVLDAQQELLEAQLAVVRAERDAYVAGHQLLQAVGGLDARALSLDVPIYNPDLHRKAVRTKVFGLDPARPD